MAITTQPKFIGGRRPLIDNNLVIVSGAALPNKTSSTPAYVKLPRKTSGRMMLIVWNSSASNIVIGTGEDLTITPLVNNSSSGAGNVPAFRPASTTRIPDYVVFAGTGVTNAYVIAKTGRAKPLPYAPGDIIFAREIDETLLPTIGTTEYSYMGVKFTTTVDLSANTVSAAIIPII